MLKLNYKILLMDCIYKTNIYNMLLYITIRVMFLNTTNYIAFAFLLSKTVDNYHWILDIIKKLYKFLDILNPKVIIINTKSSIIYANLEQFPLMSHLLYF